MISKAGKITLKGTFKITLETGDSFTVSANTFHRAAQIAGSRLCGFGAETHRLEGEQGRGGKFKAYNNGRDNVADAVFMVEDVTEAQ